MSSLMALPPELRLQIYTHLLVVPPSSSPATTSPCSWSAPRPPAVHPSILLASHAIYQEALPLLYSKNTFMAHNSLLTSFPRLYALSSPVREAHLLSLIRRVRLVVRLDCGPRFTRAAATSKLSGLEELVVDVVQAAYLGSCGDDDDTDDGPYYKNLTCLEGVRDVRKAVVRGSTSGFRSYARWLRDVMESPGDRGIDMDCTG